MSKITTFDRTTCQIVRTKIDEALKPLSNELGISIRSGNGKFASTTFSLKIEMACVATDGTVSSKEAEEFKMLANSWGMKPEDLGKQIMIRGTPYKITGSKCRSYKFPNIAQNVTNGKMFKFPFSTIKAALGYSVSAVDILG